PMNQDIAEALGEIEPGTKIQLMVARNNEPVDLEGLYQPQIVKLPARQLFDRSRPWGRVDLRRNGNTVTATTHGVSKFTLLASPDQFDFSKPIVVVANGKTVFNARVQKDRTVLLKWAARDNDRTMLFGGEVNIDLK